MTYHPAALCAQNIVSCYPTGANAAGSSRAGDAQQRPHLNSVVSRVAASWRRVMRAGASLSAGPLALVQEAAERLLARELAGQAYVILTKVR